MDICAICSGDLNDTQIMYIPQLPLGNLDSLKSLLDRNVHTSCLSRLPGSQQSRLRRLISAHNRTQNLPELCSICHGLIDPWRGEDGDEKGAIRARFIELEMVRVPAAAALAEFPANDLIQSFHWSCLRRAGSTENLAARCTGLSAEGYDKWQIDSLVRAVRRDRVLGRTGLMTPEQVQDELVSIVLNGPPVGGTYWAEAK